MQNQLPRDKSNNLLYWLYERYTTDPYGLVLVNGTGPQTILKHFIHFCEQTLQKDPPIAFLLEDTHLSFQLKNGERVWLGSPSTENRLPEVPVFHIFQPRPANLPEHPTVQVIPPKGLEKS
jgi:hypothetical protein